MTSLLLRGLPAGSFHWSNQPAARGQRSWLTQSFEVNLLGTMQRREGQSVDLEGLSSQAKPQQNEDIVPRRTPKPVFTRWEKWWYFREV